MNTLKTVKKTFNKFSIVAFVIILLAAFATIQVGALDISGPITTAINEVISQFKGVVKAVLTLVTVVLIAALVFRIIQMVHQYREGEQLHYVGLVLLIVGLVISGTATTWMWTMV